MADEISDDFDSNDVVPVRNELLCFVIDKCNIIAVDQLSKLCADFYRDNEIEDARKLLSQVIKQRLTKHTGKDRGIIRLNTMKDIVKICLDPTNNLPQFYATELSRLPPTDINHCDMSAVLSELQSLRQEVRTITSLQTDVEQLKKLVSDLESKLNSLQVVEPIVKQQQKPTFAQVAENLSTDNSSPITTSSTTAAHTANVRRKPPVKSAIGKSGTNNRIKAVKTVRSVEIFVSRLDPDTTTKELIECVNEMKGDIGVVDIQCEKLKSKFEELYSSYHVSVKVDAAEFSKAIELFLSGEGWPAGVFLKRYFVVNNGAK